MTNQHGVAPFDETHRAKECAHVLGEVQKLVISFIEGADRDAEVKSSEQNCTAVDGRDTNLLASRSPEDLSNILNLRIPETGQEAEGLLHATDTLMRYSVNTFNRGFMDKLYASTDAPGLAAELILATLNTNLHVYTVSPALTLVEKTVSKELAKLFGFIDDDSGGISVQGGSASNLTSLLIARNYCFPETKSQGMSALKKSLIIFTSIEAHYSVSTASVSLGFGADAVWSVPVDQHGCMDASQLEHLVQQALEEGKLPFYVSATAGTTVRGAYDPLVEIGQICRKHKLWFHVDAAWGGPAIFSKKHRHKLNGSQLADTIAINPHKMMGVPITCSFLLGKDLRKFHAANSLSAGYLFHKTSEDAASGAQAPVESRSSHGIYDLASLTAQCGRRGDSLKLYLSWIYHGTAGYEKQIDAAFATCHYMASEVCQRANLRLIGDNPPPCCQCCFYYWPQRSFDDLDSTFQMTAPICTQLTRRIAAGLVLKGWMVDYAPGEYGEFLRVVTNRGTTGKIVDALLNAVDEVGGRAFKDLMNGRKSKG